MQDFVCKNCGNIITTSEFEKQEKLRKQKQESGCIVWFLVIICFVSMILIPIAIILLIMMNKKEPKNVCPFCNAKDSLIPSDSPIAKKMLKDNYSEKELSDIQEEVKIVNENINKKENNKTDKKVEWITGIIVGLIILSIVGNSDAEKYSPRSPQELECVEHKGLCIATTDVKYDYTAVKSPHPEYSKKWNNGWASAQKACKAWGGRLPYMEDFPIILDANFERKIRLKEGGYYLTGSEINWHRVYAFSNSYISSNNTYDKKNIYDHSISISKSADWEITGDYTTSTVYNWSARCVKKVKKK